jgi:RimJ/RimL family protein N-acetyltransferase
MIGCKLAAMDELVTLRPVVEDDLSWLAGLQNDPAASGPHEWHGWSDPQRRRRRWAESGLLGDDGGTLIVLHGTDRVGHVSWRKVKTGPTAFGWAIGVGLVPEFRGRGYGSAAQRLLTRYLFAHTQVNRIEATTEITNVAEQRALEKAGFTREGILRGTTFRQGRWHDQVIYSVLRGEVKLEDAAGEDSAGQMLLSRSCLACPRPAVLSTIMVLAFTTRAALALAGGLRAKEAQCSSLRVRTPTRSWVRSGRSS